ncbi:MAG: DUF2442 domain-containing protein [Simkaniaceae bacterium]|nr:DUF2442 domain-containing protein [Simkaniaceae bacterium]
MGTLALKTDERVEAVYFTRDSLVVDLMDGRTISVPLTWYPKLLKATSKQRSYWELCGGGYGIHWPDLDEDLSTDGLLRGSPAPNAPKTKRIKKPSAPKKRQKLTSKNKVV